MNGENILIREYLAEWDIVCHRAAAFLSLVCPKMSDDSQDNNIS